MGWTNLNFRVTDASGRPLGGATAFISQDFGAGLSRTTDGSGFANFGVFGPAWLTIAVEAPGYAHQDRDVHVDDGVDVLDTQWALTSTAAAPAPAPPTPPPAPPVAPPIVAGPVAAAPLIQFVNLSLLVRDSASHPIVGATVTISQDFGNGTTRTTDSNGFANFGVYASAKVSYKVDAGGHNSVSGTVDAGATGTTSVVVLGAVAPPPAIVITPRAADDAPQYFNLSFVVHDARSGAPVVGALIQIDYDSGNGTTRNTDSGGFANFGVVERTYAYFISRAGYQTVAGAVFVNTHTTVNPALTPGVSVTPTPFPGGPPPSGAPFAPGPTVGTEPVSPIYAPPLAPVQFDVVDGVPRIRPDFFVPPEVGSAGGPIVIIALISISFIASLFTGRAQSDIGGEVTKLRDKVVDLARALVNYAVQGAQIDGRGSNIFEGIWGKVLGPLINAIATLFRSVHDTLANWLGPLLKLIQRIQDIIKRIYNVWLRPILRVIDTVRGFLRILELFHIKWAQTVDDALGTLERKLTAPILLALSKLNELSNWVNRIVNLNGIFQRATLLQSLAHNVDGLTKIWWNAQNRNAELYNGGMVVPDDDPPSPDQMLEEYRQFFEDDSGPLQAEWTRWIDGLNEDFPG